MSVKVWISVSLRGATNFIVVSSLRWVDGARVPSKGWRPLSCHHCDDSENDSDFVEKFLSRYLNRQGLDFREYYASTILTKMLTSEDPGYVDLMSPAGIGIGAVVYN